MLAKQRLVKQRVKLVARIAVNQLAVRVPRARLAAQLVVRVRVRLVARLVAR